MSHGASPDSVTIWKAKEGILQPMQMGIAAQFLSLRSYLKPVDGLGSPGYGSSTYTNPSNTYSSYQFGSGLPPPPPAYQATFLH